MKSKQFCSVCKEWLEMEVVPTGDGEDDDGVVWYRCPQCQGFLPKLKGTDPAAVAAAEAVVSDDPGAEPPAAVSESPPESSTAPDPDPSPDVPPSTGADEDLPWDSPADMMASRGIEAPAVPPELADVPPIPPVDVEGEEKVKPKPYSKSPAEPAAEPEEPIQEYRDMLDATDQGDPRPYRPWDTFEVGECIMHLAWEDCGVVVAKEELPGGRQVIKCFFSGAGVVRLIEQAPR